MYLWAWHSLWTRLARWSQVSSFFFCKTKLKLWLHNIYFSSKTKESICLFCCTSTKTSKPTEICSIQSVSGSPFTGDSRYVDFTYLDTITYVEVIFHSQHFFCIFLCISTLSMSKMVNMKQRVSRGVFHALDVFSIIFATVYIEVINLRSHRRHIVCFGYVHVLAEVRMSSKQQ